LRRFTSLDRERIRKKRAKEIVVLMRERNFLKKAGAYII